MTVMDFELLAATVWSVVLAAIGDAILGTAFVALAAGALPIPTNHFVDIEVAFSWEESGRFFRDDVWAASVLHLVEAPAAPENRAATHLVLAGPGTPDHGVSQAASDLAKGVAKLLVAIFGTVREVLVPHTLAVAAVPRCRAVNEAALHVLTRFAEAISALWPKGRTDRLSQSGGVGGAVGAALVAAGGRVPAALQVLSAVRFVEYPIGAPYGDAVIAAARNPDVVTWR